MYLGDTIVLISINVIPIDIETKNIAMGMRLQAGKAVLRDERWVLRKELIFFSALKAHHSALYFPKFNVEKK